MPVVNSFSMNGPDSFTVELSNGRKILFGDWGFELGNWYSFFSLRTGRGLNSSLKDHDSLQSVNMRTERGIIELLNAEFSFTYCDSIESGTLKRSIELIPVRDSFLGDVALRASFPSSCAFKLNGKSIHHRGSNLYRTFPERSIFEIDGVRFTEKFTGAGEEFLRRSYIRDERTGKFIFHSRIVAAREDELFIKIIKNNKIIRKSILLQVSFLKYFFYYARERFWAGACFQICSNSFLKKGETLQFGAEYVFDD